MTIPSFRDGLVEMLAAAELVTITERIAACRDPTDDKFFELALNGHADLIVSGDADLLALNPFRNILSSCKARRVNHQRAAARPRCPFRRELAAGGASP